jgi:DtxR family Mn-dependent transcriptional regulator
VYATLATCVLAKPLRIVRVTEQSAEFLQFVEQNDLRPGATTEVTERNLAAGLLLLKRGQNRSVPLSLSAAGNILVEPVR